MSKDMEDESKPSVQNCTRGRRLRQEPDPSPDSFVLGIPSASWHPDTPLGRSYRRLSGLFLAEGSARISSLDAYGTHDFLSPQFSGLSHHPSLKTALPTVVQQAVHILGAPLLLEIAVHSLFSQNNSSHAFDLDEDHSRSFSFPTSCFRLLPPCAVEHHASRRTQRITLDASSVARLFAGQGAPQAHVN
ncbi:hypothetical protein K523DRAFT_109949 [Schizophyllum commune Tattone D]|nr:hypothetical protein K523DRAFT_109949 [Schizophyllum commune Tattone D]